MRVLFLLLAARPGAGVAGSELLQRREWPRGVVLGLSRERGHGAALAAAGGAAPIVGEAQQQLQAVQRNASYLSRAARRLAGLCENAGPRARSAQSARLPAAESVWLAISAKAFPAFWATPNCAQCDCCAGGRPRCGAPRAGRGRAACWLGLVRGVSAEGTNGEEPRPPSSAAWGWVGAAVLLLILLSWLIKAGTERLARLRWRGTGGAAVIPDLRMKRFACPAGGGSDYPRA